MKKSYLVIGLGRFGSAIALELARLGNEVSCIDLDSRAVEQVADYVDNAAAAEEIDERILRAMGATECDCAIVAFSQDIQNSILVTLLLKELGVPQVVAKARNDLHVKLLTKLGADRIVFPERDMGVRLAEKITYDRLIDHVELAEGYGIAEVMACQNWVGKSLRELEIRRRFGVNVLLIKHKDGTVDASFTADTPILEGDTLVAMGRQEELRKFEADD